MYVGVARLSLSISQAHSLKEKRMVIRRVKDRVRERLGLAVSEVGELDVWQRAELGVAVTSGDRQKVGELLDDVIRVARAAAEDGDARLVGIAREVTTFDAPSTPIATEDAVPADWIPDAWKDELE